MKIKKLLIKNYKSIENVVIELNEDFNVFVGENDSGKSTILEALSIKFPKETDWFKKGFLSIESSKMENMQYISGKG